MVDWFENVSGSTSVLWFVVVDAWHVACVNGSSLTRDVAARAPVANTNDAASATPTTGTPDNERRISSSLSDDQATPQVPYEVTMGTTATGGCSCQHCVTETRR